MANHMENEGVDWFFRVNTAVLIVLVAVTAGMIVQHELELKADSSHSSPGINTLQKRYEEQLAKKAWLYKDVLYLEKKGDFEKAASKVLKILKDHPNDAYGLVLLGRLYSQQGQIVKAVRSYRRAVELDPDYVDKTTPLYIGDEIMKLISGARGKLNREKKLKPEDKQIQAAINDIYYLQRRIAGGCE